MTWSDWYKAQRLTLRECCASPLYYLLKETLGCAPQALSEEASLDGALALELTERYRRFISGEPLAYVLGTQPFLDHVLRVDRRVLIPRVETEQWVALFLAHTTQAPKRVLDVGTGSGCIALSIQKARPNWEVWACDVSHEALEVARANSVSLGVPIRCVWCDIYAPDQLSGTWDYILSNPPYLSEEDWHRHPLIHAEPRTALVDRSGSGLSCYAALFSYAQQSLLPGGAVWCEHGLGQRAALVNMAQSMGFYIQAVYDDDASRDRVVVCRKLAVQ